MKKQNHQGGFTLVELLIVIGIVGLLSTIAYPSYKNNVERTRRSEARTLLQENAQFMERYFTENSRYDQNPAGVAVVLPILVAPRNSTIAERRYNISFVPGEPTANTFVIRAVPVGSMATDVCGTYTLDNVGVRTISGAAIEFDKCWNK